MSIGTGPLCLKEDALIWELVQGAELGRGQRVKLELPGRALRVLQVKS